MQIGIIAAQGRLPVFISKELKKRGYRVITVGLKDLANEELKETSDVFEFINIGQVGKVLEFLKKNKVSQLLLTGKVPKKIIFETEKIKPDMRALKMLFSAKLKGDNELLKIVEKELRKEGIKVVDIGEFCPELLTPEGVLTKRKPSQAEWQDIEYGFKIAKKIGELDIGQTVVVKDKSVISVEGIEGTDETIRRAGKFVEDFVVVKTSKPQQNMKLDPPVAGMDTILVMIESRASVLALEAEKTILFEREEVVKKANEFNISIVGVREN